MVHYHRSLLERRVHGLLGWVAIGAWTVRSLDHVGLFQLAMAQFSLAEIGAAVEEAEAFGRYTLAHAYTPEAITRAVSQGVRTNRARQPDRRAHRQADGEEGGVPACP